MTAHISQAGPGMRAGGCHRFGVPCVGAFGFCVTRGAFPSVLEEEMC